MRPMDLKYCVNIKVLKSTIALGLIDGVLDYESLSDATLREYLEIGKSKT